MLDRRWIAALVLFAGCRAKPPLADAVVTSQPPPRPTAAIVALPPELRATESGGVALARIGERLVAFVADADDRAIVALDAQTLAPIARTDVGAAPRDLLVLPHGRLLATLPEANVVAVLVSDGVSGELAVERRIATSTEPLAIAASSDGQLVAVTAGASHHLDVLDQKTLVALSTFEVAREPRAVLFTKGHHVFVSHAAEGRLSTFLRRRDTLVAGPPIDLGIPKPSLDARGFDPPRAARHADALVRLSSAKGERVLVPLVENAPSGGAPPGGGYGGGGGMGLSMTTMMIPSPRSAVDAPAFAQAKRPFVKPRQVVVHGPPNRMSAFDLRAVATDATPATAEIRSSKLVPSLLSTCLLPRAALVESDDRVLVACSGESEVLELDATAAFPRVAGRIHTGRGPAAIARVSPARAIVWAPLARKASLIELGRDGDREPIATADVARTTALDATVEKGRELFYKNGDPRISKDGLACASCHPDGRDDGLVWASPRGRRRTRTLAGNVARSSAFGWGGEHPTIHAHVRETIKRLRGTGLPDEDLAALLAYVRSMRPLPEPDRPDEPASVRGAQVFASERAACATCHDPSNGFTDNEPHEVGFQTVVTPSLLGVGSRPALFHDGRYSSLERLVAGDDRMGGLSRLDAEERSDLVAFLRTL